MILLYTTDTYKNVVVNQFVFLWRLTIKDNHHSKYYIVTGLKNMIEFDFNQEFQAISTFDNVFHVAITFDLFTLICFPQWQWKVCNFLCLLCLDIFIN